MARDHCWNTFPDKVTYFLTEIDDQNTPSKSKQKAEQGHLFSFEEMMRQLLMLYPGLHDINLYVHSAEKDQTIVDVRYYPKSNLPLNDQGDRPSMLHAKVPLPPYRKEGKLFDIHWDLEGFKHQWRFFWWKLVTRTK